jgi:hypothetical protein
MQPPDETQAARKKTAWRATVSPKKEEVVVVVVPKAATNPKGRAAEAAAAPLQETENPPDALATFTALRTPPLGATHRPFPPPPFLRGSSLKKKRPDGGATVTHHTVQTARFIELVTATRGADALFRDIVMADSTRRLSQSGSDSNNSAITTAAPSPSPPLPPPPPPHSPTHSDGDASSSSSGGSGGHSVRYFGRSIMPLFDGSFCTIRSTDTHDQEDKKGYFDDDDPNAPPIPTEEGGSPPHVPLSPGWDFWLNSPSPATATSSSFTCGCGEGALPCTATLWAANRWFVCFLPSVCLPLTLTCDTSLLTLRCLAHGCCLCVHTPPKPKASGGVRVLRDVPATHPKPIVLLLPPQRAAPMTKI